MLVCLHFLQLLPRHRKNALGFLIHQQNSSADVNSENPNRRGINHDIQVLALLLSLFFRLFSYLILLGVIDGHRCLTGKEHQEGFILRSEFFPTLLFSEIQCAQLLNSLADWSSEESFHWRMVRRKTN